jgi:hypothetical protein
MVFIRTASCAIQEISSLSSHPSSLDAMVDFCQQNLINYGSVKYGSTIAMRDTIYSFYLFTCAVSKDGGPYFYEGFNYGPNFARFIKENDLGSVLESEVKVNEAYHSDHANQVFIWSPNLKALRAWWDKYRGENSPKVKVEPKAQATQSQNQGQVPYQQGVYNYVAYSQAGYVSIVEDQD